MSYSQDELAELRLNACELRGCGHTVQQIAQALKLSQAETLRLLDPKAEGYHRG